MWLTLVVTCCTLVCTKQQEMTNHVVREYSGDVFTNSDCGLIACDGNGRRAAQIPREECRCQCAPSHKTYQEDVQQCIKDVGGCRMAMFVRPFEVERIPLVTLPMTGQLVYPGAHLNVSGITQLAPSRHLSCKVNASDYMTANGWQTIKKEDKIAELFGIYHDGNKTFLQWLGDDDDRRYLQHRLVLIRLMCMGESSTGVFQPCAALRIGWALGLETSSPEPFTSKSNNYIIIGLCLGILGLIYVLAVLIYLKVRKARQRVHRASLAANLPTSASTEDEESVTGDISQMSRNVFCNALVLETDEKGSQHFTICPDKSKGAPSSRGTLLSNGVPPDRSYHPKCPPGDKGGHEGKSDGDKRGDVHDSRKHHFSSDHQHEGATVQSSASAHELFHRIRGVLSAAKGRFHNLRYKPTLRMIPEDDYFYQDFKEDDIEAVGDKKTNSGKQAGDKAHRRLGAVPPGAEVESIHGPRLEAVILETNLNPPVPPPRHPKSKVKKRAPLPPGTTASGGAMTPPGIKNCIGGCEEKSCEMGEIHGLTSDVLSKFDTFRLDLYEKLRRMHEAGKQHFLECGHDDVTVLEVKEGLIRQVQNDWMIASKGSSSDNSKSPDSAKGTNGFAHSCAYSPPRFSRRHVVSKFYEEEKVHSCSPSSRKSSKSGGSDPQHPSDNASCSSSSENEAHKVSRREKKGESSSKHSSSEESSKSTSSGEMYSLSVKSDGMTLKKVDVPSHNREHLDDGELQEEDGEHSDASCSGDSLDSPRQSRSPRTSSTSHNGEASPSPSGQQSNKEIDDRDVPSSESLIMGRAEETHSPLHNSQMAEDSNESSLSTDDREDEDSIDGDSEHPSLEEYLQLSNQVAKKLSESKMLEFGYSVQEKEKSVLTQLVKDFKSTLGRIGEHFDKPKAAKPVSAGYDNWTLKKEAKREKVSRKTSFFKRNLLNSRRPGKKKSSVEKQEQEDGSANESEGDQVERSSIQTSKSEDTAGSEMTVITINPTGRPPSENNKENGSVDRMENVGRSHEDLQLNHNLQNGVCKDAHNASDVSTEDEEDEDASASRIDEDSLRRSPSAKSYERITRKGRVTPDCLRLRPRRSFDSDTFSVANSDMTEDSLNLAGYSSGSDTTCPTSDIEGPIEKCLAQLASTMLCNKDEGVNGSRATKGIDVAQHFRSAGWQHVCQDGKVNHVHKGDATYTRNGWKEGKKNGHSKIDLGDHEDTSGLCRLGRLVNGDGGTHSRGVKDGMQNGHSDCGLHSRSPNGDAFISRVDIDKDGMQVTNGKDDSLTSLPTSGVTTSDDDFSTADRSSTKTDSASECSSHSERNCRRARRRKTAGKHAKKGLNGTCRQHIQSRKFVRMANGAPKGPQNWSSNEQQQSHSDGTSSEVTVIQLDSDPRDHVTNVDSSSTFVTLIAVESSDCSKAGQK